MCACGCNKVAHFQGATNFPVFTAGKNIYNYKPPIPYFGMPNFSGPNKPLDPKPNERAATVAPKIAKEEEPETSYTWAWVLGLAIAVFVGMYLFTKN